MYKLQYMNTGIYKIEHIASGKKYIGSALRLSARICEHKRSLTNGRHENQKLQHAWNKYGPEAFVFETLLYCSKENLLDYEQRCIDGSDAVASGYNICPVAGSPMLGRKHTISALEKIASASRGNQYAKGKNLGNQYAKGVQSWLGKVFTPEHCANISLGKKGFAPSQEQNEQHSMRMKGNTYASGNKGKPKSLEHRAKIAAGQKIRRDRERTERCM